MGARPCVCVGGRGGEVVGRFDREVVRKSWTAGGGKRNTPERSPTGLESEENSRK
jgi:hypothetical protein